MERPDVRQLCGRQYFHAWGEYVPNLVQRCNGHRHCRHPDGAARAEHLRPRRPRIDGIPGPRGSAAEALVTEPRYVVQLREESIGMLVAATCAFEKSDLASSIAAV